MVTDLMGDHVGAREIAGRAEAAVELAEEVEVDVHLLIGRTIEWPGCRRCHPARRLDQPREHDQLRRLVALAARREDLTPGVFGVGQNHRDELGLFILCWRSRSTLARALADLLAWAVTPGRSRCSTVFMSANGSTPSTSAAISAMTIPIPPTLTPRLPKPVTATAHIFDVVAATTRFPSHECFS